MHNLLGRQCKVGNGRRGSVQVSACKPQDRQYTVEHKCGKLYREVQAKEHRKIRMKTRKQTVSFRYNKNLLR